jgi:biopolymer transport protein TolR
MPSLVNRGRGRRTINEINMVPFIDVMLVLLIIFMVTAPLIAPSVINLPSVGKGSKQPDVVIQIVIAKDESLTLKSQEKSASVTLKDLVARVKSAQTAKPDKSTASSTSVDSAVVISADRSVKYEAVVKVMDVLQRAGVQRVGLSVQLAN